MTANQRAATSAKPWCTGQRLPPSASHNNSLVRWGGIFFPGPLRQGEKQQNPSLLRFPPRAGLGLALTRQKNGSQWDRPISVGQTSPHPALATATVNSNCGMGVVVGVEEVLKHCCDHSRVLNILIKGLRPTMTLGYCSYPTHIS